MSTRPMDTTTPGSRATNVDMKSAPERGALRDRP